MRHRLIPVFLIVLFACTSRQKEISNYELLKRKFNDPPMEARPKAYWTWLNGNVDTTMLDYEMAEAKVKGLGGFDIWDVGMLVDADSIVPKGPAFMGPESVKAIAHAVREAEKYDMEMGLTISSSWNAGGSWVTPEYGVQGLFRSSIQLEGSGKKSVKIPAPGHDEGMLEKKYSDRTKTLEPNDEKHPSIYRDVALLAFRITEDSVISEEDIIDFTQHLGKGMFDWDIPAGKWQLTRYTCMPTGQALMVPSANSKGLMIDHFSADAMKMHLDYFFDKLKPAIGDFENSSLKYLYTDSYEANSAAWTPDMPDKFQELRGYDITKYLPVLDGFTINSRDVSARFAYDYRKTLSDLIIANHYAMGKKLCNEQGLEFVAEAGGPGPPVHNVPFQDLAALGSLSVPRGEFWYDHPQGKKHMDELQIVKGISSAAHIYDQKYVEAESFTSVWLWQEGPAALKPVADKAFCEGLNRIVYHTFPHIPPEAGDPGWIYNFGTVMNTHRAWWPMSRAWNDYLARISYMMQQGNFVADIAYYYGDEAPNFVGHKKTFPWLGEGYDYDAVNTEILVEKMDVEDGRLVLPHGQSYSVLVLPSDERMDVAVLEKIAYLVEKGAIVIGSKPSKTYGLHNYQADEIKLRGLADRLWGNCDGVNILENSYGLGKIVWGKTPREVLEAMGLGMDFSYQCEREVALEYIHRQTDDLDIYFIRSADSTTSYVEASFRTSGIPEIWDPVRGIISEIPVYEAREEVTKIPVFLGPYGSSIIVFRKGLKKDHIEKIRMTGDSIFPDGKGFSMVCDSDKTLNLTFDTPGKYEIFYRSGEVDEFQAMGETAISLENKWNLHFDPGWDAPESVAMDELVAWNHHPDKGVQVYSGLATYEKHFSFGDLEDDNLIWLMQLGEVYEVADVTLNGENLGIRHFPPYTYEISDKLTGENTLKIEVANLLNNQLVGEGRKPKDKRKTKSNIQKLPSAWGVAMGDAPLKDSGLIGPVRIVGYHVYNPKL